MTFQQKLAALLNEFNWDTKTKTPDHALARQIEATLQFRVIEPEPEPEPTPGEVIPSGAPPNPGNQ